MRKIAVKAVSEKYVANLAGTLLLLAGIACLVGCQGVSAGSPSNQQQASNLSLGSASLNFGSVSAGSSKTMSVTASNSGAAPITVTSATISTKYFSLTSPSLPVTIAAGQSASISVKFAPTAAGTFSATATVASDASDAQTSLSLSGTGVADGQLALNPIGESFGNVTVGTTQSATVTLTNNGGTSVNISQVSVSGAGFQMSGISAPLTLNASQHTSFTVAFAPQTAGSANGAVTITSDASNPTLTMALSGTGSAAVGQLTVSPTTLGLGNVVVGTSATASGSLTATGANVTVTAAGTNNSVFSVGGLSLPLTIPAGQSAPFKVTFSPQISGTVTAALSFTSNAQPATTSETLTGTGTPAPTHTVNLSWTASSSPNISGYNIHRAAYVNSCGSFSKINSLLNSSTLYSDSTVVDGTNYCYATTAVNSSNEESGYSNIVSNVQIPAP